MQERHVNRKQYFDELAVTSKKFYIPYIRKFIPVNSQTKILEIGCGDGGNLLPFAELGCQVTGVDMAETRIKQACSFFAEHGKEATLIASDIFKLKDLEQQFDLILVHDVIEHISDKRKFISDTKRYLKPDGIIFMAFPAWQMPFGGHQQICQSKVVSHLPFIHLLPDFLYVALLKRFGERADTVGELLNIKSTRTSIELFYKIMKELDFKIIHKQFYFINPHYEVKFGLHPRRLPGVLSKIPYLRNFFTSSCFFMIAPPKEA